jgi:TRAP-type C4-dicarboxylate transport system substrate-binding protein
MTKFRRVGGLLACGLAVAASGAEAETVLRLSNWVPPSHLVTTGILGPWSEDVARVTEGRVRVELLKAPLGKPPAHFDIARDGLADVAIGVHGYTPGRFVLTQVAELPFLSDSAEALSVAFWRVYDRYLARAGEHKGVHLLALWTHGPGHIFNARREIDALDDLAGLKFRVGGGLVSRISESLGTVAVQAPATKAYELLANGVADGIYFPTESVAFFNLVELMRYATLVPGGLYNASFFLVANEDSWRAIDPADRAAIMAVSGEALARRAGRAWDAADRAGLEVLTAAGANLAVMDAAMITTLRERLAFAEADWVARASELGVDGAVALAALRAEIAAER